MLFNKARWFLARTCCAPNCSSRQIFPNPLRSLGRHPKTESALAYMQVLRDGAPGDFVSARSNICDERQPHQGRSLLVRPQVTLIHLLSRGVAYFDAAYPRLDWFR